MSGVTAVFFFAATALTLVSYAVGPFGLKPEDRGPVNAALFWIILFFSAATGLPRAFVREEDTGTALALRRVAGEKYAALIRDVPDETIAKIVAGWPRNFSTKRAEGLGFTADASFDDIIRAHIADELGGKLA